VLPPDARSVLSDALRPPPGAALSRAVALTFTLDLEALLIAPLAFAAHAMRESADPIAIMEGVRRCADRIDVFCQAGQISVPPGHSGLLAFVEPMVHPVRRPRPGHLFHPKLWALRFDDETTNTSTVRLLVLSRNLTKDRSWDVCLRLDGLIGTRPRSFNRPLFDLIKHAMTLTVHPLSAPRRAGVEGLAQDLRRVEWELPDGVREISFHALGVPGAVVPDFGGTRTLVISPFCSPGGLRICAPGGAFALVSRQDQLDRLPEDTIDDANAFVVSELAGISAEELPADQHILTGLHAKLYVVEKGHTARILLGSANATEAAFQGNTELLVELLGSRAQLGIDSMVGPTAPFRVILEPYDRGKPEALDTDAEDLRDIVRDIAAMPIVATVSPEGEQYTIKLTSSGALPSLDGVRMSAELMTRRGEASPLQPGQPIDALFTRLALVDITPFVVITAQDRNDGQERAIVLVDLVGDPVGRLDQILAQQVDTAEKFLRFLMLLLGLGDASSPSDLDIVGGRGAWITRNGAGILELLLNALADRPEQVDDLARLMERIESTDRGRDLLPQGFAELWRAVDEVRQDLAGARP
jgi:hypothetical protein